MTKMKQRDREKLEYIGKLMEKVNDVDELGMLSDIFFDCLRNYTYIDEKEFDFVMDFHNCSIQKGYVHIFNELKEVILKQSESQS